MTDTLIHTGNGKQFLDCGKEHVPVLLTVQGCCVIADGDAAAALGRD